MQISLGEKINYANIGLMIISCIAAFVLPFELFLFAYAIMGPLHYLTEISWLHDRQYYTKGKYDFVILLVLGAILLIAQYAEDLGLETPSTLSNRLIFIAFLSALVLALVKNKYLKILGVLLLILTSNLADNWEVFLSVFLPTLIHVYVFTGIFVLYGALKSRSISGVVSFFVLIGCMLVLFLVAPGRVLFPITSYGTSAYKTFESLNLYTLRSFFDAKFESEQAAINMVYHSTLGITLMRFIAFAYTYHYLNWFSKTEVIQWHKISKQRLVVIILLWLASIAIYLYDYAIGFEWLFFLSFLHVFLEFPLNFIASKGIIVELLAIIGKPKLKAAH
jgi:hypothetical protein